MEKSHQIQPLSSDWNITVPNSKSNLHRLEWRSMSSECAHQKSAQLNHILTLIEAHDQNCPDRKLTKTEALFSDWKTTIRNSKSDLHHSDWRSISYEPLLPISGRSTHKRSGIRPLMKSGQWRKTEFFSLTSKMVVLPFSFFSPSTIFFFYLRWLQKNWKKKKKKRDSSSNHFI